MKTRRRFSAEFKAKVALERDQVPRDGRGAGNQARLAPDTDCVAETAWGREANSRPRQIAGT